MKKNFMFGSVIFCIFLIALMIGVSFAWYAAKTNQGNINNLVSEGINITLNENDEETLEPSVLIEGVLYKDNEGNYVYPNDYPNDIYFESKGNTLTYKEKIEIYLNDSTATMTITVSYKDKTGEMVVLSDSDLAKYFDFKYDISTSDEANYASYTGPITLNSSYEGVYNLHLSISYKLPDELLPSDLVNSDFIVITASAAFN